MYQCIRSCFNFDQLSIVMIILISFIGICIGSFAFRYLKGDTRYRKFFCYLACLVLSLQLLVISDHFVLFFGAWCISNLLLMKLMIHKSSWKAAKYSGFLAGKNYLIGATCIAIAFTLFYLATGEVSIKALINKSLTSSLIVPALCLLLLGGMTQSAIWPFHRWLISSLNSPTPVSAIMHAGLVNGGGFLLVRFAPLYLKYSNFMTTIFVIGMVTALIGTFWKLVQSDVKRMLACSTMGQMGFMLAQCGLGLFPAAIAHLVTHGMFKAYLFLASGGAAQEKRYDLSFVPKKLDFIYALICGVLGSYCFALASGKSWLAGDTTLVLIVIAFLAASQSALSILSLKARFKVPLAIVITSVMSLIYGFSMYLITKIMEPMQLMQPQALNGIHIAAIILLVVLWVSILVFKSNKKQKVTQPWVMKGYVAALNASQPHPKTVTTHRNQYKYL